MAESKTTQQNLADAKKAVETAERAEAKKVAAATSTDDSAGQARKEADTDADPVLATHDPALSGNAGHESYITAWASSDAGKEFIKNAKERDELAQKAAEASKESIEQVDQASSYDER